MIKGFWLLFLTLPLLSGTILNQNIYEKEDSVDIMLSFDSPYEGNIIQKKGEENKIFILEGIKIEQKTTKDINSPILQKLQLIPYENQLFIELIGEDSFDVDASKTVDNYGLRLRVTPQTVTENMQELSFEKEAKTYQTKKEDDIGSAYLKVMLVLAALIAFLYLLKNYLAKRGTNFQGSWLFDKNGQKEQSTIKIKQQKALDVKNRISLVSYGDKEYLLLLGSTNLLLDTFEASQENDFDKVLTENEDQLSDFIKLKNKKFDNYKQKLSS